MLSYTWNVLYTEIKEKRKMEFRCFHYDIARGAYLKPQNLKTALKMAADEGFTHFLPYLENMIRLTPLAKASVSCAYTPDQWRQFDETAANSKIELIPHFNVIGHSVEICREYPELSGGEGGFELDVTLDSVMGKTVACLEEYCSFSAGKHFLIGGDEWQTPNHLLADPHFNVVHAWAQQINLAVNVLKKHGRIPIVWHDMLLHYPETLELLSKDAVIAFWFYDEDSDYPALDFFQSRGFKTIMASGLCNGFLSDRRRRAIECAVKAAITYRPYGTMITTWSDGRWEKQALNIKLTSRLLRGETVPEAITGCISRKELLSRFNNDPMYCSKLEQELEEMLEHPVWSSDDDTKRYKEVVLGNDSKVELSSYRNYHFAEGPLHAQILGNTCNPSPKGGVKSAFDIETKKTASVTKIIVRNGSESFVICPEFGGTLQDYRLNGREIIPDSVTPFIGRSEFMPGGYRSYSAAGGLRPIWALGAHHNPCILWQYPFQFEMTEERNNDCFKIKLTRSLYHVDVNYLISVQKGRSGFIFEAEAVNKLDNAIAMFGFNLPISYVPDSMENVSLLWEVGQMRLSDARDGFLVLPARKFLKVVRSDCALKISVESEKTAGFYMDMHRGFITPDLRGEYTHLKRGEKHNVKWEFSIGKL